MARVTAEHAPGGVAAIRKRFWYPTGGDRWRGLLRTTALARSRVQGEAEALTRLAALGLQPALLLAWGEWRRHGFLRDSFLYLRELDARPLDHWIATATRDERAAVAIRLGAFVAAWHGAGVVDHDLHLRNFLISPDGALVKIDSPFARVAARAWRGKKQARERAQLAAELQERGGTATAAAFSQAAAAPSCRG